LVLNVDGLAGQTCQLLLVKSALSCKPRKANRPRLRWQTNRATARLLPLPITRSLSERRAGALRSGYRHSGIVVHKKTAGPSRNGPAGENQAGLLLKSEECRASGIDHG